MRAWLLRTLGEPAQVLTLEDVPRPEPDGERVLVEVATCGLNFSDVLLCRGEYQDKPAMPFTPGTEVVGRVLHPGARADLQLGQRVLARPDLPAGGLAEEVLARPTRVHTLTDAIDDVGAAALHVTYQTAWFALHHRASLLPGETLLVHAGAGGTGSAAIQLGVAGGARVLATAGGAAKTARCRELGAEVAIDYRSEDFVAVVREVTGGQGADVVFDPVGGDTFDRSRRCTAFEGRIVVVGFAGGRIADLPTNHPFIRNYAVLGLNWPMYEERRPDLVQACHQELLALHAAGHVRPVVTATGFSEAPAALTDLAARRTTGKVVLSL